MWTLYLALNPWRLQHAGPQLSVPSFTGKAKRALNPSTPANCQVICQSMWLIWIRPKVNNRRLRSLRLPASLICQSHDNQAKRLIDFWTTFCAYYIEIWFPHTKKNVINFLRFPKQKNEKRTATTIDEKRLLWLFVNQESCTGWKNDVYDMHRCTCCCCYFSAQKKRKANK